MHIPKTGGTIVHAALTKLFPPEEVCPERFDAISFWSTLRLSRYRLFSAHGTIEDFAAVPKPYNLITFLRSPKERVLSAYRYGLSVGTVKGSLADFLARAECNVYARYLTGRTVTGGPEGQRHRNEVLDKALLALETISFVGITEHLDASLRLLSDYLDIPTLIERERMNVTGNCWGDGLDPVTSPSSVFNDQVLERLQFNTSLDEVIYKRARERVLGANDPIKVFKATVGGVAREHIGQYGVWAIATGGAGCLMYGPYELIFPGRYVAEFSVRLDSSSDDGSMALLGRVDAACRRGNTILAERPILRADFGSNQTIVVSLEFDVSQMVLDLELRVFAEGKARIWASTSVGVRIRPE